MAYGGLSASSGDLSFVPNVARKPGIRWKLANFRHWFPGLARVKFAELFNLPIMYGTLSLVFVDGKTGERTNYDKVGYRVVTTVGAAYIIDALQNLTEGENLK